MYDGGLGEKHMSQVIAVKCHACGYATQVPIEMAGQQAQCPSCRSILTISPVGMPVAAPLPPQPFGVPSAVHSGQKKVVGWIIGGVAVAAVLTVTLILTLSGEDQPASAFGGNSSFASNSNSIDGVVPENTSSFASNSNSIDGVVPENTDVQREIQLAADILNENVPQRMDEYTELVAVEAGPMELIYKYRVSLNLNRGQWQQVENVVRRGVQADVRTRNLLSLKVKMTYEYRGPTGGIGHRFTIH